ncbi:winged helix-turn-helix domain-containing protein [Sediminihabitans luteus]|nr:winged helix-turn-helix domain-containing protein [Sediminihabitans luteus]
MTTLTTRRPRTTARSSTTHTSTTHTSTAHSTTAHPTAAHTAAARATNLPAAADRATAPPAHSSPRSGFLLYVGSPDTPEGATATELAGLAETLRDLARDELPGAETYTSLAFADAPAHEAGTAESIDAFRARLAALTPVPRVEIDTTARTVRVDGAERTLTARELRLLTHLAEHSRRVVTRAELLAVVWGGETLQAGTRTLDVHVRRLREKLGLSTIRTVRGVGYGLDPHTEVVLQAA